MKATLPANTSQPPGSIPRVGGLCVIPQARLLFWFGVVALPFALAGALRAEALAVSLLAIGALALAAVADLVWAQGSLSGVEVRLPALMRFSRNKEGAVEVRLRNASQKPVLLRVGLVLPPSFHTENEVQEVALPGGCDWSRIEWRLTPRRRGRSRLRQACVGAVSPLGLWLVRALAPVDAELRVYPNLLAERRRLAALFLHRGAFGMHVQRQVGKGREFEKLREYVPGDDFGEIHWKATAKRGRPVTKVFQIERTQEVYVVIDASRLSSRAAETDGIAAGAGAPSPGTPIPEQTVLERYVTAALVLGLAAQQQGDLFGLIAFSDRVEGFLRAQGGKSHYAACRDAIYALEPRQASPDFEEVASFIRLRLRRRALLVFLTALDDPVLAEGFMRGTDLLRGQHLLLVSMMKPPGAQPLFSRAGAASMDDLYERLGGHLQWQRLRELEMGLRRRGVSFSLLQNERLAAQLVSQYLEVKRRQTL